MGPPPSNCLFKIPDKSNPALSITKADWKIKMQACLNFSSAHKITKVLLWYILGFNCTQNMYIHKHFQKLFTICTNKSLVLLHSNCTLLLLLLQMCNFPCFYSIKFTLVYSMSWCTFFYFLFLYQLFDATTVTKSSSRMSPFALK